MLPVGAGRSFGDCGTLVDGPVIDSRRGAAIHDFDPATGIVTADAGVSLGALLARVAPGHMLPVVPGSPLVTLGGAIANDIHGRNHHRRGSFGAHVIEITLRRSDVAGAITLRPGAPLFAATVGGMGMTGLIERARVKVMPVPTTDVREGSVRFARLEACFEAVQAADAHEYALAWLDGSARGTALGRGQLVVGDHQPSAPSQPAGRVSAMPSDRMLDRLARRAHLRAVAPSARPRTLPCGAFFFPLETGRERPLRRNFHRHQSVVPPDAAEEAVGALLRLAHAHGQAPRLALLQRLGESGSPATMGFARPGYGLTLDVAMRGPRTLRLLDELDAVALDAGGAVNPATDRRMSPATFARAFPSWQTIEMARDPAILSDFWCRTAIALRDGSAGVSLAGPSPARPAHRSIAAGGDPMTTRERRLRAAGRPSNARQGRRRGA